MITPLKSIPLTALQEEQERLLNAQKEINELCLAFAVVTNYLGHRVAVSSDEPVLKHGRGRPPKQLPAAEPPPIIPEATITERHGFWDAAIVEAIQGGAKRAGDIWKALLEKHTLPTTKRSAFHLALSRAFKKRVIKRRKGGIYCLPGEPNAAEPPATDSRQMEKGYWQALVVEAVRAGAVQAGGIWKLIQDKYNLDDSKHVAFLSGLAVARKRGLLGYKDNQYSLPHKVRRSGTKMPRGFWNDVIAKAIFGGANTVSDLWKAVQTATSLPDNKKDSFYPALGQMRDHHHVIEKNGVYSLPARTRKLLAANSQQAHAETAAQ